MHQILHGARLIVVPMFICMSCAPGTLGHKPPSICGTERFEGCCEQLAVKGKFEKAYSLLLPCAEGGDAAAQFAIGILIESGFGEGAQLGLEERDEKAFYWIKRAAIGGDESAMHAVAGGYWHGHYGLPKDPHLESCWRSAADGDKEIEECLQMESEILE